MKKVLFLGVIAVLFSDCATQKTTSYNCEVRYDTSTRTGNKAGSISLKTSAFGPSKEKAKEEAKKCAVRAIIFRGVSGSSCQYPLVRDPDAERKDAAFYDTFFTDSGTYLSFVTETAVDPVNTVKEKGGYRFGLNVIVNYSQLQTYLENEKKIRRLGE